MKSQGYSNHSRYYFPHHFLFYPLLILLAFFCWLNCYNSPEQCMESILMIIILIMLGWLSFMMRQHYALGNQNRIIRLEMRLRYYQLTQNRFEVVEASLSFSQIAALRFASDEELPMLIEKTIQENLSAQQIKKSIKNWLPDYMRV